MPQRRYPAGPSSWAALRGMRALAGGNNLASIPIFLTDVARTYGRIAHWTMFGQHFFFLDDPVLIEEALVAKGPHYMKGRGIQRLKRLLGDGLLSSEPPEHIRRRRLLAPAFSKDRVAGYGRQMVAATQEHIGAWNDGATLAIDDEMTRLTLTIAAQTLLGANLREQTATIRAALSTVMRSFPASISRFSELLDALPVLPAQRRFVRARAELDRVIYAIIAQRRRHSDVAADDLLGMLLSARDADGGLDDRQVRDEAMTLFLAGHETTANALAWAWYLLGREPALAVRLRAELDAVLGGRPPDPADVPQLGFTRAVLAETMRLYPPAWILGRRANRETTVGEYAVPRGSVVIVSQLVTQRNSRYWPDPDVFRPERWTDGSMPEAKFAYFPFGGGNRRCIGESFAWMEGILLLATIAQQFEFVAVDNSRIEIEPLVTLRPRTPIQVRLRAREVAAT